ncbi:hypothetical protein [Caldisalinibacter kiritimatiensis]|uniref:Uncharacterized protein n=1 Tax=Caldisalinibacter kiritimatiensis TaxID=1304284 RepID=R1CS00_9FIRM|nr:hypothetical protein [Caldisalinibacter kiritimatiensis]EOD01436.1 hypothetical protein L21TH_0483 [Caldisalinibacter kiritimatiensis]
MAKKHKIDFRIGNVRAYKIAEYQKKYLEKFGKKLSNADFMRMAIDTFFGEQKDEIDICIERYETKLIKILSGIDKKEISKEEYLKKLKEEIIRIKKVVE